jgi:hypothetical protein
MRLAGKPVRGGVMRSKLQVRAAYWETRTWDAITIVVMLVTALTFAMWMVKR